MAEQWIRVKSEDELRVGMCVELKPCFECGKRERTILLGGGVVEQLCITVDGEFVPGKPWRIAPAIHGYYLSDFELPIRGGRLWRLADEPPAVEETRTRERETAR